MPVDEKGDIIKEPEKKEEISISELLKKLLEERDKEVKNKIVSTIG